MDIGIMNENSEGISDNPSMLAKKAWKELEQTKSTSVRCPKCGGAPEIKMTPRGERTIVTCPCRYVHVVEINF